MIHKCLNICINRINFTSCDQIFAFIKSQRSDEICVPLAILIYKIIRFTNAMFILLAGTAVLQSTGKFDNSFCESLLFIYNKCSYKYSDCHLEMFGMEVFMDNRLIIYHFSH